MKDLSKSAEFVFSVEPWDHHLDLLSVETPAPRLVKHGVSRDKRWSTRCCCEVPSIEINEIFGAKSLDIKPKKAEIIIN